MYEITVPYVLQSFDLFRELRMFLQLLEAGKSVQDRRIFCNKSRLSKPYYKFRNQNGKTQHHNS